jgi:hypothetical protein
MANMKSEVAEYIGEKCTALSELAAENGLEMLARLLRIARLEAAKHVEHADGKQPRPSRRR